jgi:hypothetical protein
MLFSRRPVLPVGLVWCTIGHLVCKAGSHFTLCACLPPVQCSVPVAIQPVGRYPCQKRSPKSSNLHSRNRHKRRKSNQWKRRRKGLYRRPPRRPPPRLRLHRLLPRLRLHHRLPLRRPPPRLRLHRLLPRLRLHHRLHRPPPRSLRPRLRLHHRLHRLPPRRLPPRLRLHLPSRRLRLRHLLLPLPLLRQRRLRSRHRAGPTKRSLMRGAISTIILTNGRASS